MRSFGASVLLLGFWAGGSGAQAVEAAYEAAQGDPLRLSSKRVGSVVWAGGGGAAAEPPAFEQASMSPAGAATGCEASLRLPWGPIADCKDAIVAGAIGATAAVSFLAWWGQGFSSRFNVANEAWFGNDTYAGGIDKLGHAYSFYVGTRLGTRALGWADVPHRDALRMAAGLGLGVGLGIEVLDGLSRSGEYGFSWQDMTMNVLGIGTAMLMESNPALDRRLAFRWMYRGGGPEWYDRHVYLAAFRLSGLSSVGRNNPLRYVEFLAGYGASGFRSDFEFNAGDTRRRTVYLGIGLDLTELLNRGVFARDRGSRSQRWTEETLRYVQLPGTALAGGRDLRP